MRPSRRTIVGALGASFLLPACAGAAAARESDALATLETKSGGRLGVAILDTGTERIVGHRAAERFGMCSTFKLPLAAVILAEIDAGRMRADQWVPYGPADMVPVHPVTGPNLPKGGMPLIALAEGAQKTSDNVAANLMLRLLGGPAGFTTKLRTMGDNVTRLDRFEPSMNLVMPGEFHDTTTPEAMARLVGRLVTANPLTPASRNLLIAWMVDTKTGLKRIRAGLPAEWRSGDKTGTAADDRPNGMVNKYNDVAIAFPPDRAPIVIASYLDAAAHFDSIRPEDEAILAEVGRIATRIVA
ncbi:MAG: class A beta-lactamase [Sphingomonadales bacterium]